MSLEKVRQRSDADAKTYGYYLNPDPDFLQDLLEGLKKNEERYGYPSCPCRRASGNFEYDRDIICPCDYRDPDVKQHGACYCALYVGKDLYEGEKPILPIPERRPMEKQARAYGTIGISQKSVKAERRPETVSIGEDQPIVIKKIWYCKQCGYVVFREDPPYICPICKAKKELFAEIEVITSVRG